MHRDFVYGHILQYYSCFRINNIHHLVLHAGVSVLYHSTTFAQADLRINKNLVVVY